jgi:serine protease inhibitor
MISQVIHEAVIEVNEKGTEAAAATAATMKRGGAHVSRFSMIVDRPFFYAIRDNQTSALLFMGFVLNPTT